MSHSPIFLIIEKMISNISKMVLALVLVLILL